MSQPIPISLIESISARLSSTSMELDGRDITILGGSGFVGSWVSECLRYEISQGLNCRVRSFSRTGVVKTQIDLGKKSHLFQSIKADLSEEVPKDALRSDCFLIAATSSSPEHGSTDNRMLTKTSNGILRLLDELALLETYRDKNLVHLSSGAVYQIYGSATSRYPEDENLSKESRNAYVQSKLKLELASRRLLEGNLSWRVSNPRIFALYGPGLATDAHFAIGNFIGAGIRGQDIEIRGNPKTVRSYLHIADLTVALLKLLVKPASSALNLGSSSPITIQELAESIAIHFPASEVRCLENRESASYYVPETENATKHLGQIESINFADGIAEWIDWLKHCQTKI